MGRLFDSLWGDIYNDATFHNRQLGPSRPLWTTLLEEEDQETLDHLWGEYKGYYETSWPRIERMRLNICSYVGLNHFPSDIRLKAMEGMAPQYIGSSPRLTTALIQAMVNQQVTQALLVPMDIAINAIGTDFSNSLQAEAVKDLMDAYDRKFNKARGRELINRRARVMGEAYRHIYWNRDKGPLDPVYKEKRKNGDSTIVALVDGKEYPLLRPLYQGDLDEDVLQTWDVGIHQTTFIGNSMWGFVRYLRPTDELLVDYAHHPDRDEIEATTDAYNWSSDMMAAVPIKDHTLCVDFYYRNSPYLPNGYYARITPGVLLEQGPNPYPEVMGSLLGNIPFERLTDLDIDGSLHGWSRIQNLQQGQNQYDNAKTMVGRNLYIAGNPKWMLPKGAANITRLSTGVNVVQYTGPIEPKLVTYEAVPQSAIQYKDGEKADMEYVYGSNAIARGEPPKGVTANAALQFLDQQQTEANTLWQKKEEQHIIDTYGKRLAVVQRFFSEDDERFYQVLGQDQKWKVRYFDVKSLANEFEIGLVISSDLPVRKDARMQTIFQMSQIWPTLFPPEAIAQMFKLGHVSKFLSAAAASYEAAELENWKAMHGEKLDEPMSYEDLVVHWRTHKKQMHSAQYRMWPEKRQKILHDHQLTTELLMLRKMRTNQVFGAQLQQLGDWPLLLALPDDFGRPAGPPGAIPPPPPEQGQGAASKTGDAELNQQRFPNGQFGQGRQAVAA